MMLVLVFVSHVTAQQAGVNPFHITERANEEETEFDHVVDLCMKARVVRRIYKSYDREIYTNETP